MNRISQVILLLFSVAVWSQETPFEELIHEAERANGEEAIKKYELAFTIKDGKMWQIHNLAKLYSFKKDTIYALKYLFLLSEKGYGNIDRLEQYESYFFLHNTNEWAEILKIVRSNYSHSIIEVENMKINQKQIKQDYTESLISEGFNENHKIYGFWDSLSSRGNVDSPEEFPYMLIAFLDKVGWVDKSLSLEGNPNRCMWIFIRDIDSIEIIKKYLPAYKNSVAKGESSKENLILLEKKIKELKNE